MSSPAELSGLIFDLDGTLANTLPLCYSAFRTTLAEVTGNEPTDEEIEAHFGPTEEGVLRSLAPLSWRTCLARYQETYRLAHTGALKPFPGLREALETFRARGLSLAVVTGKGPISTRTSLRHLAMLDRFDPIETGSPRRGMKDRSIRRVLDAWGLPPQRAAYVGDSTSDLEAAERAGVVPVAAAWAPTSDPTRLHRAEPVVFCRTIADLVAWVEQRSPPLSATP